MNLFRECEMKLAHKNVEIVFPEGNDLRILTATAALSKTDLIKPLVIGNKEEINQLALDNNIDISSLEMIDPNNYSDLDEMVNAFVECRKGKIDAAQARELVLKDHNYFGTMLVYMNKAQGLVSGAVGTTANTVRPALQIIKMHKDYKLVSGIFLILKEDERYLFGDCAININPDAETLSEIAICADKTARQFGIDPKIGFLSFSTKGSASSPEQEKVAKALQITKEKAPQLECDGELQLDAAFVPSVAAKKAPGSEVAGHVNTFIFPTLDAGNIGYKIAERFGKYQAIGPILQGLAKPVNDLSRGCNSHDVYNLALITAVQAIES